MKALPKDIANKLEECRELGEAVAEARKEVADADAEYRSWRGKMTDSIGTRHSKWPEWKVKAAVEAEQGFLNHKRRIASAGEMYDLRNAEYKALQQEIMFFAMLSGINPAQWLSGD